MATLSCVPIGTVENEFTVLEEIPLFVRGTESKIRIFPEYLECLRDIEQFKHLYVYYWCTEADRTVQKAHIRKNPENPKVGVLATRGPNRPNPIAMTLVEVLAVDHLEITVKNLDALNGSPILDIKPFDPAIDAPNPRFASF